MAVKNNAINIRIAESEKGMYLIALKATEQHVHAKFYKQ
ncbi:MAG: hypothetical protein ACJAUQ_000756 [Maribacter sp.]|jgi:hypothetical protein